MRVFLAFVLKEFMHILRDVRTMLLLLGMPVVQVLLFGFALNTEVRNLRVAVIDLSHDAFSERLSVAVLQNPSFSPVRGAIDLADVDGLMRRGELELAVVVAPDFYRRMVSGEQGALQLIVDGSNPNVASIAAGYVQQILAGLLMEQSGGAAQPYAIDIQTRMLYNPALESTYNFVPGIIGLVLIIICSIMTSVSIVRERERAETGHDAAGQDATVPCALVRNPIFDPVALVFCAACTHTWEYCPPADAVDPVRYRGAFGGPFRVDDIAEPGGGDSDSRRWDDDADALAVGYDVPD